VDERELLHQTADYAADFLATLDERPVSEEATLEELTAALGGPLPQSPMDPRAVIASLVEAAEPGLVASPSGRWFGFVLGGALPASLAADWLTSSGTRTPASTPPVRPRRSSKRSAAAGSPSCSACLRTPPSRSSPAVRWRT